MPGRGRERPGDESCVIGLRDAKSPGFSAAQHDPAGVGPDVLRRFKMLEFLASFIGPNSAVYAEVFRDTCYVSQNLETLRRYDLDLVGIGEAVAVPELVNTICVREWDISFTLSQIAVGTYPIENVLSATGTFDFDDRSSEPWLRGAT